MPAEEKEKIEQEEVTEHEMTFLEHLEELRWRIIFTVLGIVVGMIVCWVFIDFIVESILLAPAKSVHMPLQNLRPFGQLYLYFEVAAVGGIILSIPNIFYQIWKFVSPALRESERKYALLIVMYTSVCFLIGIAFAYFVMLPLTLSFAVQFGTPTIKNEFALDEYVSIVLSLMLASGIVFELPMVSYFLTKLGILKPQFMRKYRRHAIVVIFIAAAILTPGTDPLSQVVLATPLFLLYELSIFISKISVKKT
ncbi:MAG: twin-arginine translocase subunit TatC [Syntrophothermus sp.]|nr:twin-arginine translocase subunit TatC [Ignavibacteriaceae bacterium]